MASTPRGQSTECNTPMTPVKGGKPTTTVNDGEHDFVPQALFGTPDRRIEITCPGTPIKGPNPNKKKLYRGIPPVCKLF